MEFCVSDCTHNLHPELFLHVSQTKKKNPSWNEPSSGFINFIINVTFQNYCDKSTNKDYDTDRATVFAFLAA